MMQKIKKEYTAVLELDYDEDEEYGYLPRPKKEGFDAFTTFLGVCHDLFEHWFEGTIYFPIEESTIAGEVIASGVREWLHSNSEIVKEMFISRDGFYFFKPSVDIDYLLFNFNSKDNKFKLLPDKTFIFPEFIEIDNEFDVAIKKETLKKVFQDSTNQLFLKKEIDRYYSYGYCLAEFMFKDYIDVVYRIFSKFKKIFFHFDDFSFNRIEFVYECKRMRIVLDSTYSVNPRTNVGKLIKQMENSDSYKKRI